MGVWLMAVSSHNHAIQDYIKLSMGPWGELEIIDMLPGPAQGFSCHPGSP